MSAEGLEALQTTRRAYCKACAMILLFFFFVYPRRCDMPYPGVRPGGGRPFLSVWTLPGKLWLQPSSGGCSHQPCEAGVGAGGGLKHPLHQSQTNSMSLLVELASGAKIFVRPEQYKSSLHTLPPCKPTPQCCRIVLHYSMQAFLFVHVVLTHVGTSPFPSCCP